MEAAANLDFAHIDFCNLSLLARFLTVFLCDRRTDSKFIALFPFVDVAGKPYSEAKTRSLGLGGPQTQGCMIMLYKTLRQIASFEPSE